jgi:hypothetical protein
MQADSRTEMSDGPELSGPVTAGYAPPSPRVGESWGGGALPCQNKPPTPIPSPPGGGEAQDVKVWDRLIGAAPC